MKHLVISFISPDRPGLVDQLSNTINQFNGNWQTSSMHHLSGFFAGVIEVAIDDDKAPVLIASLQELPNFKLNIEAASTTTDPDAANVTLELTANDRVGIVKEISSVIHQQGGNLLNLNSSRESAPHSGQDLFKAQAKVTVTEQQLDALIDALENLADDLMVDISRK
ncbi:glycine cleavage system protein R [Thalassotalea fusca]